MNIDILTVISFTQRGCTVLLSGKCLLYKLHSHSNEDVF